MVDRQDLLAIFAEGRLRAGYAGSERRKERDRAHVNPPFRTRTPSSQV
jgi:hypothetical protein